MSPARLRCRGSVSPTQHLVFRRSFSDATVTANTTAASQRTRTWEAAVLEDRKAQAQSPRGPVSFRNRDVPSNILSPQDIAVKEKISASRVLGALINDNEFWEPRRPFIGSTLVVDLVTIDNIDQYWSHSSVQQAFQTSAIHLLGHALQVLHGDSNIPCEGQINVIQKDIVHYDGLFGKHTAAYINQSLERLRTGLEGDIAPIIASVENDIRGLLSTSHVDSLSPPTNESLTQLAKIIKTISSKKSNIDRIVIPRDTALRMFAYNPFKLHILATKYGPNDPVHVARCGEFIDFVDGRVLGNTGAFGGVKVLSTNAAAWARTPNDMEDGATGVAIQPLSRVQVVAFPTQKMLKDWETLQELAEKRNHRVIGQQQKLFMLHPFAPGSAFLLPHGTRIAHKLMDVIRGEYRKFGFQEVVTPILFNKDLWVRSGHWKNYKDDMFLVSMGGTEATPSTAETTPEQPILVESSALASDALEVKEPSGCCGHDEDEDGVTNEDIHGLKPMNCPAHCLIYQSVSHSYRDLPLRLAEFSPLHRNEASGALSGLSRVRKFHQDDGHIFCTPEQIHSEITSTLRFIDRIYTDVLRLPTYDLALSTRPATNYIGALEEWDTAESTLRSALDASGRTWTIKPQDGAFYGPKIDVMVRDALGRVHQTATVQLDFQLPRRFELSYTDADGGRKRPVMIHRAVLGSVERMMAMLIEHTGGRWPFWISPRQGMVVPVNPTEEILRFAEEVAEALRWGGDDEIVGFNGLEGGGVRRRRYYYVDVDRAVDNTLKKRVRSAQVAQYNFIMLIGPDEISSRKITVRARDGSQLGMMSLEQVRAMFEKLDASFE